MQVTEFVVTGALLVFVLWVLSSDTFEGFIGDAFNKIVSIPTTVRDTITPALDRMIHDASNVDQAGETIDRVDYEKDPDVLKKGKFDEKLFERLVTNYESVDKMLNAMQYYNKSLYNSIIKV